MIKSIQHQPVMNSSPGGSVFAIASQKTVHAPPPPPPPLPLPLQLLSPSYSHTSHQQNHQNLLQQQLSPQIANPVLIIHQNKSVSSNVAVIPASHQSSHVVSSTNLIIDDLNLNSTSDETLLHLAATELTQNPANSANNSEATSDDQMSEIKYMKAYIFLFFLIMPTLYSGEDFFSGRIL